MYGQPDTVLRGVQMAIHVHFFVTFDVFKSLFLVYYWVY